MSYRIAVLIKQVPDLNTMRIDSATEGSWRKAK